MCLVSFVISCILSRAFKSILLTRSPRWCGGPGCPVSTRPGSPTMNQADRIPAPRSRARGRDGEQTRARVNESYDDLTTLPRGKGPGTTGPGRRDRWDGVARKGSHSALPPSPPHPIFPPPENPAPSVQPAPQALMPRKPRALWAPRLVLGPSCPLCW